MYVTRRPTSTRAQLNSIFLWVGIGCLWLVLGYLANQWLKSQFPANLEDEIQQEQPVNGMGLRMFE